MILIDIEDIELAVNIDEGYGLGDGWGNGDGWSVGIKSCYECLWGDGILYGCENGDGTGLGWMSLNNGNGCGYGEEKMDLE